MIIMLSLCHYTEAIIHGKKYRNDQSTLEDKASLLNSLTGKLSYLSSTLSFQGKHPAVVAARYAAASLSTPPT